MLKTEGSGWDVGNGKYHDWQTMRIVSVTDGFDQATLFLLSNEARWITAHVMPVDAGVS